MENFKRRPLADRFWAKVDRRGADECWTWMATTTTHGYGQLWSHGKGAMVLASHVSWELHNGPIPDGLWVLHSCDNPPCVNPAHLWLGTHQDNMDDKATKGRGNFTRGEANHSAKLTTAQVVLIRKAPGPTQKIAQAFGISQSVVSKIINRKIWRHVQ